MLSYIVKLSNRLKSWKTKPRFSLLNCASILFFNVVISLFSKIQHYPYEASGGQKQRCACARAIINNPQLVLADEPTGALDSHSAQMLLETMYDMNKKRNTTFIMVTHDALSASYAKRVIFLKDGKIYIELQKGEKERRHFFTEILDVVALLGGERKHVS